MHNLACTPRLLAATHPLPYPQQNELAALRARRAELVAACRDARGSLDALSLRAPGVGQDKGALASARTALAVQLKQAEAELAACSTKEQPDTPGHDDTAPAQVVTKAGKQVLQAREAVLQAALQQSAEEQFGWLEEVRFSQ